jgi:glycosyltransferase involved in cell wall biosynthesis
MRPYKGLDIFLQAMDGLDAEANVVGDGPYKNRYERYSRKLGLTNVHFYGNVSDEELRRMYLGSDVLVLPSVSMNEAFGLVTLEAASAGCAVVASDLPGLRDVVKDFGLLVKPNDPHGLRDVLLTLENGAARAKYVAKGRRVVKEYSWQKVAEKYTRIYSEVISGDYAQQKF